ncbi:putative tRNA pseudouridine synthase 1 [Frankliniella fusca]|uniref:tRNA pseudouridine synthase 1 n=1 Tax=Frankliniella fusca TaxID=407009 RepID=A0AAE1HVI4_9NEOP|nr:putative tRNA pseudouridine synthase 1 [Frankliniella fusca]
MGHKHRSHWWDRNATSKNLGRSLQWQICLLHFNELPLRHLVAELDGPTSGHKCFSGPIGATLRSCENMPIVKFTAIKYDPLAADRHQLSTDQWYLYDM